MLDYNLLKLANIFSNPQSPTFPNSSPMTMPIGNDLPSQGGITGNMPNTTGNEPDLMTIIQGLLNPKDEQFNNYSQMINQMPKRSDYKPSWVDKLAAVGAQLGSATPSTYSHGAALGFNANVPEGIAAREAVLNEPYNKALSDWSNKLKPSQEIAQMEQTRNVGNRATALGTLQRKTAQDAQTERERANLEKERQNQEKIEISRAREEAYVRAKDFAEKHPNYEGRVDKDGKLVYVNKTNPSDIVKTDIDTGQLDDMKKINLQIKGRLEEIRAQGEQIRLTKQFEKSNPNYEGRIDKDGMLIYVDKNDPTNIKETGIDTGKLNDAEKIDLGIEGKIKAQEALENLRQPNRIDLKRTPSGNSSATKPQTPSAAKTARVNRAIAIVSEHPELKQYFVYGANKQPTGELLAPKNPEEPGFLIAQRLISGDQSDTKLPSQSSTTEPTRELTRPSNQSVEDPKIKAARDKVEKGYVLITDGKSFGQVKPTDTDKLPKGWMVVK